MLAGRRPGGGDAGGQLAEAKQQPGSAWAVDRRVG